MSYGTLISTQTLASTTSTVTFSAIPQTFTDLLLVLSARDTGDGGNNSSPGFRFNGSSASNYSYKGLYGGGSSFGIGNASATSTNMATTWFGNGSASTANTFGVASLYIPNYSGSTVKSFSTDSVTENNANAGYQRIDAGIWNQTAAITSIDIIASFAWAIGCTFSLYGILKGSGGATVA